MRVARVLIVLAGICSLAVGEACSTESVLLREPDQPQRKREAILLYIAADGRLFSDSGPTTEKSLQDTFKEWRTGGTEPGIRLMLFPSLKSNSDLKAVRRIIDFLRANKVGYDIMLEAADVVPNKSIQ